MSNEKCGHSLVYRWMRQQQKRIDRKEENLFERLENVAINTVCDVLSLTMTVFLSLADHSRFYYDFFRHFYVLYFE